MAKGQMVSLSVVKRLPRYYRYLKELEDNNTNRISSRELAEMMHLTASQIRQDLNCFGGFGQQGYGYNVSALRREIAGILGLDAKLNTVLIGAGNLGKTIATQLDFENMGFTLMGVFDQNQELKGQCVQGIPVQTPEDLESFCQEHHPQVAILCIPKESAPTLFQRLIACGIRGFWNFSHYDLGQDREGIVVENVNLGDSLMTLSYRVKELERKNIETQSQKENADPR